MADCCSDFTRASLARHAVAESGRGLPAVEAGMPVPAGSGMSRRSFVLRSAGLMLSVYGASTLSLEALEEGVAHAAPPDQPVLVSVFLNGGIDSLSLLAPVGDPAYASLRPTLAVPPDQGLPFSEDERLRWHPVAASLATLHGEGKVTVFPAIGYSSPNQSHFTSRHFWEVGELNDRGRLGWLGRYLDRNGAADNPLQGLSMNGVLFPSLATGAMPVAAVTRAESYSLTANGVAEPITGGMHRALGALGEAPAASPALQYARDAARAAARVREQLAPFSSYTSPVTYPAGQFGQRLAGLAAMLGAGLPLRCVALDATGRYDTHSNQQPGFESNVKATFDTLLAFQRDIESRGLAHRVLVQVWSEFGRRAQENGSGGTDHGAGGIAFVMGARARGQMVGEFPGLAQLDEKGNLRSTSDFRALYCSLLEQWLGADAEPIIPGASGFPRPEVVKAA